MWKRVRHIMSWSLVKKSAKWAAACVAAVSTVMGVVGVSLVDFLPESFGWVARLAIFALAFVLFGMVAAAITCYVSGHSAHFEINNTNVEVKIADLFSSDGIKVIPFDEYFDAEVDDKVISKNSLNGTFLEQNSERKDSILQAIVEPQQCVLGEPEEDNGRLRYRLGTIKVFDEYALLAFTHMDECDRAYLERGQYEDCLLNMWYELDRIYAGKRVVLPLLGSGITRFNGCARPSEDDLLRCMLCTLRMSGLRFKDGVLIALTRETADRMRLYEVKDYTDAWRLGMGESNGL